MLLSSYAYRVQIKLNNGTKFCLLEFITDVMFRQVTTNVGSFEKRKLDEQEPG
jgi:hypothetical protein